VVAPAAAETCVSSMFHNIACYALSCSAQLSPAAFAFLPASGSCTSLPCRRMHKQLLAMFCGNMLPGHPSITPARLFSSLYQCNLLQNWAFLERDNTLKTEGLINNRRLAWVRHGNVPPDPWCMQLTLTDARAFLALCSHCSPHKALE
jgi:hypothetical protein